MLDYTFKTYIFNGWEHYEYSVDALTGSERAALHSSEVSCVIKKDFLFPESLLSFLYLDIGKYELQFAQVGHTLRELIRTKNTDCARRALLQIEELSSAHVYFELLYLEWRGRLREAERRCFEGVRNMIPPREFIRIPAEIATMQKQIGELFQEVLDLDGDKRPVSEKMARYYYRACREGATEPFQFKAQPISFELIDKDTFAELLCPATIHDLVDYHLRECVRRELKIRTCINCGRYFVILRRTTAENCDRVIDERGRTCKDIGASRTYEQNKSRDLVFMMYRREYKKRFAQTRAGKLKQEVLYAWGEKAREKKAECEEGKISLEEFDAWLKKL